MRAASSQTWPRHTGDLYRERFGGRLRLCGAMRRAAFVPGLAEAAIRIAGISDRLRRGLALATRGGRKAVRYTPNAACEGNAPDGR